MQNTDLLFTYANLISKGTAEILNYLEDNKVKITQLRRDARPRKYPNYLLRATYRDRLSLLGEYYVKHAKGNRPDLVVLELHESGDWGNLTLKYTEKGLEVDDQLFRTLLENVGKKKKKAPGVLKNATDIK